MTPEPKPEKQRKGFAVMRPEEVRRIASMGGKATPPEKRAFSRDRDLAVEAGKKGGAAGRHPRYPQREGHAMRHGPITINPVSNGYVVTKPPVKTHEDPFGLKGEAQNTTVFESLQSLINHLLVVYGGLTPREVDRMVREQRAREDEDLLRQMERSTAQSKRSVDESIGSYVPPPAFEPRLKPFNPGPTWGTGRGSEHEVGPL